MKTPYGSNNLPCSFFLFWLHVHDMHAPFQWGDGAELLESLSDMDYVSDHVRDDADESVPGDWS